MKIENYWIGLKETHDGKWGWESGVRLSQGNDWGWWKNGEPNNHGNEDCASVCCHVNNRYWVVDSKCKDKREVLCVKCK